MPPLITSHPLLRPSPKPFLYQHSQCQHFSNLAPQDRTSMSNILLYLLFLLLASLVPKTFLHLGKYLPPVLPCKTICQVILFCLHDNSHLFLHYLLKTKYSVLSLITCLYTSHAPTKLNHVLQYFGMCPLLSHMCLCSYILTKELFPTLHQPQKIYLLFKTSVLNYKVELISIS